MQEPIVLFQDNHLLVLNKPAGWVVNDAKTTKSNPVVQSWLRRNFSYPISQSREFRSGIVHRIDKQTSGVLLVAKQKEDFFNLQKQFKERKVAKKYTALVHGKLEPKEGEIRVPVGRLPWNRERFGVLPGGRTAFTSYQVSRYYLKEGKDYSLVYLFPKTGRTHQIRIHLKFLGYPIVADNFYAGRKTSREDQNWCPRLFLHASSIEIRHPRTGKKMSFEAPISVDLKKVIGVLQEVGL